MLRATLTGPERPGAEGAESGKYRGRVDGSARTVLVVDQRRAVDIKES